jgi:hypothetical protein
MVNITRKMYSKSTSSCCVYSNLGYNNFYLSPSLVLNMDKDLYVKFSVLGFICMTSLLSSRRDSHDINIP